jgi:plasmid stability protein
MRQLITRIDDELHAALRQRAADMGLSVNALVNDILASAVADDDRRAIVRRRARAAGRLVVPPRPAQVPSREAVDRATRGAGTAVSEALAAERATR